MIIGSCSLSEQMLMYLMWQNATENVMYQLRLQLLRQYMVGYTLHTRDMFYLTKGKN